MEDSRADVCRAHPIALSLLQRAAYARHVYVPRVPRPDGALHLRPRDNALTRLLTRIGLRRAPFA